MAGKIGSSGVGCRASIPTPASVLSVAIIVGEPGLRIEAVEFGRFDQRMTAIEPNRSEAAMALPIRKAQCRHAKSIDSLPTARSVQSSCLIACSCAIFTVCMIRSTMRYGSPSDAGRRSSR